MGRQYCLLTVCTAPQNYNRVSHMELTTKFLKSAECLTLVIHAAAIKVFSWCASASTDGKNKIKLNHAAFKSA